jgi:hypothetical protein
MSINLNRTSLNYTVTIPENIQIALIQQNTLPVTDNLRSLADGDSGDCLTSLKTALQKLFLWISHLFRKAASPSDPELFKKWDSVVEKDYDPIGEQNRRHTKEANDAARGHTLADRFVQAASKTGIQPPFQHLFVRKKYGPSLMFSGDGDFDRFDHRARRGEFNSPTTLILLASVKEESEERKQLFKQYWIQNHARGGFPLHNAVFLIINPSETRDLENHRMPASLITFFKSKTTQ